MKFVSSPILRGLAAVTALAAITGPAAAQKPTVRTDTVFLARDIDGSGKTDYVVKESKPGPGASRRAFRIAVYLDRNPRTRKPDWSMAWDDEFGFDQTVDNVLPLAPGATLLDVQWSGADYEGRTLLIAEQGRIRQEISHGIDYGHGFMDIRNDGGSVVVDATLANLELRGKPVTSEVLCTEPEMGAMLLVFEPQERGFRIGPVRCVK